MRGYPGSEGDAVKDGEIGFYQDVKAAVNYVLNEKQICRSALFAHGYSLGGSLAAAAGYFYNIPVILDHTFTSVADVMNAIGNNVTGQSCASRLVPEWLTNGIAAGTYPRGIADPYIQPNSVRPIITDSLNSLAKIQNGDNPFFVIYGDNDNLMPNHFATDFVQSRHGQTNEASNYLAEIPGGGHCGPFFFECASAEQKVKQFLIQNGLLLG